jgi:hypothetical protein
MYPTIRYLLITASICNGSWLKRWVPEFIVVKHLTYLVLDTNCSAFLVYWVARQYQLQFHHLQQLVVQWKAISHNCNGWIFSETWIVNVCHWLSSLIRPFERAWKCFVSVKICWCSFIEHEASKLKKTWKY